MPVHAAQMRDTHRPEFLGFTYPLFSLLFEYQFHRLGVEGFHRGQFQVFYHVLRSLLVFLEVICLQVLLIGFLRGIDFEDANLA
jgi:hypothetical protein